jgi:hypothetical protein
VPQNYSHPTIDYRLIRAGMQSISEGANTFSLPSGYLAQRKALQTQYDGRMFITEFAQKTNTLYKSGLGQLDPMLGNLLEKYPYITRLYGQMSPDQMRFDPTLIPSQTEPDISNRIDLNQYVKGDVFWGCAT